MLDILESEGSELVGRVQRVSRLLHTSLQEALPACVALGGEEFSPVKHITLAEQRDR